MYTFLYLGAVILVFSGVDSQKCSDCVKYSDCPEALYIARYKKNDQTAELFKKSHCGWDSSDASEKPIALVCCSNFFPSLKSTSEDVKIDNHPNQRLLPTDCGFIKNDKIVGGTIADLYEFPWMALISHNTRFGLQFKCGGTLINSRYVLTAAHCVRNKSIAGVRLGEHNISQDIDCIKGICEDYLQDMPIEKAIVHPEYTGPPGMIANDIALLRLSEEANFSVRNIGTVCLPKTTALRKVLLDEKKVTVTGWGVNENGTEFVDLMKVTLPVHTTESCIDSQVSHRDKQTEISVICAGALNKDSCNGDSGGPLMSEEKYDGVFKFVQYGVVSNGPNVCGSKEPGIYTDVSKYMGWILDQIEP